VATLDFITEIVFSHTRCPHLTIAQGHKVSVSDCRWPLLYIIDNVHGQRKSAVSLLVT